jgi:hypothetical protein
MRVASVGCYNDGTTAVSPVAAGELNGDESNSRSGEGETEGELEEETEEKSVGASGFEMMSLGPLRSDNDTVLIALRGYEKGAAVNASFTYLSVSLNQQRCVSKETGQQACASTAEEFYSAVLEHTLEWTQIFGDDVGMGDGAGPTAMDPTDMSPATPGAPTDLTASNPTAMQVQLPYAERRQVDMAKGVIVSSSTVWIGDEPNYGTGGTYWLNSPPAAAMVDTSGVADSLPLTSLALDEALLRWGLFGSAMSKVGYYLDTFIFPNGTIDMGHWKDPWADYGSQGIYNCTFPDSLADHGRIIQLYTDTVRMSKNMVSRLQAHKLIQIYTNTDYCLVAFCTLILTTRASCQLTSTLCC